MLNQTASTLEDEFILLSRDSLFDSGPAFDARTPEAQNKSESGFSQLCDAISIVDRRWRGFQQDLVRQRTLMRSLEQMMKQRMQQLEERERKLDAEMKQFAAQEGARREMLAEMLRLGARNSELANEVQMLKSACGPTDFDDGPRCPPVERLKSWDTLEGLEMQSKVGRIRPDDQAAEQLMRTEASNDWKLLAERLEVELTEARASFEVTRHELENRVQKLEVELMSQMKFRNLADEAASNLQVKLDEQVKAHKEQARKLLQLEEAQRGYLKSSEMLKKIMREKIHIQGGAGSSGGLLGIQVAQKMRVAGAVPHQQHQHEQPQQLDDARREIERLRAREMELEARWVECAKGANDILVGCERYRKETQEELATLRMKLTSCSELLNDYAEKMVQKANTELALRAELQRTNQQLEILRSSAGLTNN